MKTVKTLADLKGKTKKKLAVAYAQDPNTIEAIARAVKENIVDAYMVGDKSEIEKVAADNNIDPAIFSIVDVQGDIASTKEAVRMVKSGEADILMKGLVATDKYLKAVLDKQDGLLPPKKVLSHICAVELPKYDKLLLITDVAVIPFPTLQQKVDMIHYAVKAARKLGIEVPRIALLSATEKVNPKFESTTDAAVLCKMADRGVFGDVIIDGPLDVFLACDKPSVAIKGVPTPVDGDADVLVFPNIEAGNIFYKGLMRFAGGELAGLLQGTEKPVIVTSRSESTDSKYYSIGFAAQMSE